MWKNLNKILHDKNDYHLDPSLKQDVEISEELIQATIKYQKYLIPKKIKYFFEYDKLFFLRIFIKYGLKILLYLIGLGLIITLLVFIFDININIKKIPKENYSEYPIYTIKISRIEHPNKQLQDAKPLSKDQDKPSTGDSEIDSLTILNYKAKYSENIKFIRQSLAIATDKPSVFIFYQEEISKDFDMWKDKLHGIESNGWDNPYEARKEGSQYWGKYQMGESARKSVKMSNMTWEEWKNNPEIQEAAMRMWVDVLYDFLKNDIEKYNGKFLNGWSITESGIIAMAHNVGPEPVKKFLRSGGTEVPVDGSGKPATRFLILGNYNLEINK